MAKFNHSSVGIETFLRTGDRIVWVIFNSLPKSEGSGRPSQRPPRGGSYIGTPRPAPNRSIVSSSHAPASVRVSSGDVEMAETAPTPPPKTSEGKGTSEGSSATKSSKKKKGKKKEEPIPISDDEAPATTQRASRPRTPHQLETTISTAELVDQVCRDLYIFVIFRHPRRRTCRFEMDVDGSTGVVNREDTEELDDTFVIGFLKTTTEGSVLSKNDFSGEVFGDTWEKKKRSRLESPSSSPLPPETTPE
ncbi:hypothetical protein K435DRAFT_872761 [Dendrothele bispora CBS 962.96]|uniref:Uncharacterized protein n=1 Tax=Dendrothele bispora (strain CBS 962.96) TaxID=1314807 RepID=A0A4S8L213_DENBC|nr:hypothetical protein K435DRAFT_872761 [Dendrothele bispora CBS 962.96]